MKGKPLDASSALKIKEAAREVFVAKGYDGATMQSIADRAGFNKAQLHYYYRSKDALFLLIFREELQTLLRPTSRQDPQAGAPLRTLLEAWIDDRVQFLKQFPQLPLFLVNEVHRNPVLIRSLLDEMKVFALPRHFGELRQGFAPLEGGATIEELMAAVISLLVFPVMGGPLLQILLDVQDDRWPLIVERQALLAKEMVERNLR